MGAPASFAAAPQVVKRPSPYASTALVPQSAPKRLKTTADAAASSEFCAHWGLDDECLAALTGLPIAVQNDIIGKFAPKATTRDVKRLFMGFVRSQASVV